MSTAQARRVQQRRLARTLSMLFGLVVVIVVLRQCLGTGPAASPTLDHSQLTATPAPSTTPPSSVRRSSGPASSPALSPPPPGTSRDPEGYIRSRLASTGEYSASTVTGGDADAPRRWILQVESSVAIDINQTARQIQEILDNPRSWRGLATGPGAGERFQLVTNPSAASLTIRVASPTTVDRLCPLDTKGLWSCATGSEVLVNSDRWLHSTPAYTDLPLSDYRAYLINHEVGHILGRGHVGCPGEGKPAPVMMQQSKDLGGCRPNPWPAGH